MAARRRYHHSGQPLPWRHWLKWLVTVDVDRQLLLSQTARTGPWNDCANLPALVGAANQVVPIGPVLADAEFDSERNHTYIRQQIHARSIIPAKRGKQTWRLHGVRAAMRQDVPRRQYARRALVETSSLRSNVTSLPVHRDGVCSCNPAKPCCSAWLTTSTGSEPSAENKKDVNRARQVLGLPA